MVPAGGARGEVGPRRETGDTVGAGRQLVAWVFAALAAFSLLVAVLWWERERAPTRWSAVPVGQPQTGAALFLKKGCVRCHGVDRQSAGPTASVSLGEASRLGPGRLVSAMWNHAPQMRERAEAVPYPTLDHEETAHIFAYLYTSGSMGEPGDAERGRELFASKTCAACHAPAGQPGGTRPTVAELAAADSSVGWARAMWNHPEVKPGRDRPHFAGREMADLLAFVQRERGGVRPDGGLLGADPSRGWRLFEQRACTSCHSLKDEAGRVGPELGPGRELPATVVGLSGSMWNHSPDMSQAMDEQGTKRPVLETAEMADLIAFLYSSRYHEPGGSPKVGEVLFVGRGCGRCHGPRGEGTSLGPRLRGRGRSYSSVALAAALWQHGPKMFERAKDLGLPWPTLAESDAGDLMAFLNTVPRD